MISVII